MNGTVAKARYCCCSSASARPCFISSLSLWENRTDLPDVLWLSVCVCALCAGDGLRARVRVHPREFRPRWERRERVKFATNKNSSRNRAAAGSSARSFRVTARPCSYFRGCYCKWWDVKSALCVSPLAGQIWITTRARSGEIFALCGESSLLCFSYSKLIQGSRACSL